MLSVEGPSVAMEAFFVQYVPGVTSYNISAVLDGVSFMPVVASLTISQRTLTTKGTVQTGMVSYQVPCSPQPLAMRCSP